jgi:lipoprotein signal peptidase
MAMADPDVSQNIPPIPKAPPPGEQDANGSAWRDLASHLRLWPVAVIGLAIDLWTKHWAFTRLGEESGFPNGYVIIEHVVSFRRSLNAGALFGLGKGMTPLFIAASVLALLFVGYLFIHSSRSRRSLHLGLALVLAGALGNLYDRAFVQADVVRYTVDGRTYSEVVKVIEETPVGVFVGEWPEGLHPRLIPAAYQPVTSTSGVVRDFIKMEPRFTLAGRTIEIWPWVFNVADAWLVVGVGLLMLNFWWDHKAERQQRQQECASTSQG